MPQNLPTVLLVGSPAFQERALPHIAPKTEAQITLKQCQSLSDLDLMGVDLVVFRLSADRPDDLAAMLQFLSQVDRPDAIAVVDSSTEDLGIGAVARGASDFIHDDPDDLALIPELAKEKLRLKSRGKPNIDGILKSFASDETFQTVCHPIFKLKDMTTLGWEFLSRGPKGPLCQPNRFFRWGKEKDRLVEFDLACLDAALEAAQHSSCRGRLHFNLFPETWATKEVRPRLDRMAELFSDHCCLELSETNLSAANREFTQERSHLKTIGIDLAIDDIGFQARGFGLVRDLQPEVLKIDRRVINNIARHQSRRDIVSSALKLGESLGALVIAEGVEQRQELTILEELGVSFAQGFLWGKPTLPDQATRGLPLGDSRQEQS